LATASGKSTSQIVPPNRSRCLRDGTLALTLDGLVLSGSARHRRCAGMNNNPLPDRAFRRRSSAASLAVFRVISAASAWSNSVEISNPRTSSSSVTSGKMLRYLRPRCPRVVPLSTVPRAPCIRGGSTAHRRKG
jgi:hypothetical protein